MAKKMKTIEKALTQVGVALPATTRPTSSLWASQRLHRSVPLLPLRSVVLPPL